MIRYEPLLAELRDLLKDLRLKTSIPTAFILNGRPDGKGRLPESGSYRTWADYVRAKTGYPVLFRQVKRYEDGEGPWLAVGYVLAAAIAADVEIVLGANPRVVRAGIEGKASDFLRTLRQAAATERALEPAEVERLRDEIDQKLIRPLQIAS